MRNHQSWLIYDGITVENQIEVERTSGPGMRALAAVLAFDVEHSREQRACRQGCVSDGDGVQKARLLPHADGVGLVECGHANAGEPSAEGRDGVAHVAFPVAQVTAERDGDWNYSIHRVGRTAP